MPYLYEVGKLYNPNKTRWAEGAQFNIRQGQAELLLFFNNPSFNEILAVRKSPCEFGVSKVGDVIFFFYKFGSEIDWSDQPFSIHLVPEDERIIPTQENDKQRFLMQVMLIDARSGILKAMRAVTLSPEFTQELLELTNKQLAEPFNSTDYDRQIAAAYAANPTTRDLMVNAWTFSAGGE